MVNKMSTEHNIQIIGHAGYAAGHDNGDHIIKLKASEKYTVYARRKQYDSFYKVYVDSVYKGDVQDTTPAEVMENIIKLIYA